MKKLLVSLLFAAASVAASAQVWIGGTIGVSVEKASNSSAVTSATFTPEAGYAFNNRFAAALEVNYQYLSVGSDSSADKVTIGPYVRYNMYNNGNFSVFGEFGVYYASNGDLDGWGFCIRPGVSYKFASNWQLLGKMRLFGFEHYSYDDDSVNVAGFSINPTTVSIGIAYNF